MPRSVPPLRGEAYVEGPTRDEQGRDPAERVSRTRSRLLSSRRSNVGGFLAVVRQICIKPSIRSLTLSLLRGGDWQGFSGPMGSRTVMDIRQMDPPRSESCCGVRIDLSSAPQSRSNGSILQIPAPPRVLLRCAVTAWNAATLQACCGPRVATIVPPATSGPPVAVASCRTRCLECDQWSLRPAGCRFHVRGREIPAVNSSTRSRSSLGYVAQSSSSWSVEPK